MVIKPVASIATIAEAKGISRQMCIIGNVGCVTDDYIIDYNHLKYDKIQRRNFYSTNEEEPIQEVIKV